MKLWKRIDPTTVDKIGFRTMVSKTFSMPDGNTKEFQTFNAEGLNCVAVIAVTKDYKVILAKQFRAGPEKIMDELPGGFVDPEEDIAVAAERELEEETGYRPGNMESFGYIYKSAYDNARYNYFLATNCEQISKGAAT